MNTPAEEELLDTLIELDRTLKALPMANPKPNLLTLFSRIDELAEQLPATADPELRHFLQRKSYEKARLCLEERSAKNSASDSRSD